MNNIIKVERREVPKQDLAKMIANELKQDPELTKILMK